jgi:beta-lactam-binding protein with PASTA domain
MTDSKAPIAPDVLIEQMSDFPKAADQLRLGGLDHALRIQRSRLGATSRRLALAQARHPDDGETIARLEGQVAVETQVRRSLELGVQTAEIEVPARTAGTAVIHGRVLEQDGAAAATGLTVAATEATGRVRSYACTDGKGYFRMDLPVGPGTTDTVFLQVSGPDQSILYRGSEAIGLAGQEVTYRLIQLGGERKPPCSEPPERATMPSLLGQPESVALATLGRIGLKLAQRLTQRDPNRAGLVLSQEPAAGTSIESGTSVTLVVGTADAADTVAVPELVGGTRDEASAKLKEAGLEVGTISPRPGERAGLVLSQDPAAGVRVAPGTAVALTVAVRPPDQRIVVPDIVGKTMDEAWRVVGNAGLARGPIGFRDDPRHGLVIAQEPAAGTPVERSSSVHIVLGRQAMSERTQVPDLNGRTLVEARAALAGARLQLGEVTGPQNGRVVEQSEKAGAAVAVGTTVAITLARGDGTATGGPFGKRLAAAMVAEPDREALGIKPKELSVMMSKAGVADAQSAKDLAELAEAELQKKLELPNRKLARDFKRLLSAGLKRL